MKISYYNRFIEKALNHTQRTLSWLSATPSFWDEPVTTLPGICLLEKIHSEAALLGVICNRLLAESEDTEIRARVATIADQLDSESFRARSLGRVLRLPHLSPAFALPVLLREQSAKSIDIDARSSTLMRRALQHPLVENIERYPFRRLDVAWVKHNFGLSNQLRSADLIRTTCLAYPVSPIYASLTDAYAMTHAFIYDTDFGWAAPTACYELSKVAANLRGLASYAISEGDPDLLSEVVACGWALPEIPGWVKPLTGVLLKLWDQVGFLPPVGFEPSLLTLSSNSADLESYLCRSTYHPTLVGGLMACVALHRERANEHVALSSTADVTEQNNAVMRIVQTLVDSGYLKRAAPIAQQLMKLVLEQLALDNILASLVADAVLINKCRNYDLDAVLDLLEALQPLKSVSACFDDAGSFFRFQEVDSGVFGIHFLSPQNANGEKMGQLIENTRSRFLRIAT